MYYIILCMHNTSAYRLSTPACSIPSPAVGRPSSSVTLGAWSGIRGGGGGGGGTYTTSNR